MSNSWGILKFKISFGKMIQILRKFYKCLKTPAWGNIIKCKGGKRYKQKYRNVQIMPKVRFISKEAKYMNIKLAPLKNKM